jgi:hypothetical protein
MKLRTLLLATFGVFGGGIGTAHACVSTTCLLDDISKSELALCQYFENVCPVQGDRLVLVDSPLYYRTVFSESEYSKGVFATCGTLYHPCEDVIAKMKTVLDRCPAFLGVIVDIKEIGWYGFLEPSLWNNQFVPVVVDKEHLFTPYGTFQSFFIGSISALPGMTYCE